METMVDEVLRLSEHIEIRGIQCVDRATSSILRKIIGSYARMIEEKSQFQKLVVELKLSDDKFTVSAIAQKNDQTFQFQWVDRNVFIAFDKALKNLELQMQNQ